jgi:hypothetical protein
VQVFTVVLVEISQLGHLTNQLHYFVTKFSFFIVATVMMMIIDSVAIIAIAVVATVMLSIFAL